jgi:hypothetical protein
MAFVSAADSASATTAGAGAVEIGLSMSPRRQYWLTARGAGLWFRVVTAGSSGADAATVLGPGSHFLLPGMPPFPVAAIGVERNVLDQTANPGFRSRISIIRDGGTDATGILSELATVQPQ